MANIPRHGRLFDLRHESHACVTVATFGAGPSRTKRLDLWTSGLRGTSDSRKECHYRPANTFAGRSLNTGRMLITAATMLTSTTMPPPISAENHIMRNG